MVKLSIITINFNEKQGLQKTIDSVLSQTSDHFEFIVIDGNSTDGSKEVVSQYKNHFSFSVSEPDTGIYNAMNKGIKAAKGDYLLFLNSGDSLVSSSTVSEIEQAIDGSFDIYYGNLVYYDAKKKKKQKWTFPDSLSLGFFVGYSLPHQASFIRRTLFETISLYNENLKIASDWEFFMIAIINKKASYKYLDIVVSEYDLNGISSNPNNEERVNSEKNQSLQKYFPMMVDDYQIIRELNSKRVKNLLYIKQFKLPWKLLKGFSNFLLLFLPKQK